MTQRTAQDQVVKYLTDIHSIELQALEQMKRAPGIAGDPTLEEHFSRHLAETEAQERHVRERLEALGASPAALKDLAGRLTGVGFALFAKYNPDTPGKLVVHGYSYEHMEIAAYALLADVAERAGDAATAALAREIEQEERTMAERLAASYDTALEASLRAKSADDLAGELNTYLEDAHAIEAQAIQLLEKAPGLTSGAIAQAFEEHLEETREHQRLIEQRLEARHGRPSRLKDAGLRLGALNWGLFFSAQPDTPAKLTAFAYAFEHLEIAAYELLRRLSTRAGDSETAAVAERILDEEIGAAHRLRELFDQAVEAGLDAQDVATR